MRFVWIPMQWSLLWKRCSSAPVQMSLGIHFCSRSPPKIRQQRKHLLNRSDTVSLFLSLSHSLSLSLSLSFIHAKTSAKLWSFQVKLLSVCLYILKSLSSPNASNTAFLPHYFCTSLIYMIKIKKIYKWANLMKPVINISRSHFTQIKWKRKPEILFCKSI